MTLIRFTTAAALILLAFAPGDLRARSMDAGEFELGQFADAPDYGYSPDKPLTVGGRGEGEFGDRLNRLFKQLRGPRGEVLTFVQIGPCCAHRDAEGNDRQLDVYDASAEGYRPYRIYIDGDETAPVRLPRGLLAAADEDSAEMIEEARQALNFGDPYQAVSTLEPLAEDGDLLAQYELARALSDRREPDRAFGWLMRLAEAGHAVAQAEVAQRLEEGLGTAKDPEAAARWWRRAAANGDGPALLRVSRDLLAAGDDPETLARAADLLSIAAERGTTGAQAAYGLMLMTGRGVRQDPIAGLIWLFLARRGGDPNARDYYASVTPSLTSETVARIERRAGEWLNQPVPVQTVPPEAIAAAN